MFLNLSHNEVYENKGFKLLLSNHSMKIDQILLVVDRNEAVSSKPNFFRCVTPAALVVASSSPPKNLRSTKRQFTSKSNPISATYAASALLTSKVLSATRCSTTRISPLCVSTAKRPSAPATSWLVIFNPMPDIGHMFAKCVLKLSCCLTISLVICVATTLSATTSVKNVARPLNAKRVSRCTSLLMVSELAWV